MSELPPISIPPPSHEVDTDDPLRATIREQGKTIANMSAMILSHQHRLKEERNAGFCEGYLVGRAGQVRDLSWGHD